jgi:hypothetical protein
MTLVTQQHIRFFHFGISSAYIDSLATETDVVEEENCLVVTCTLSLDLGERTHRLYFVRNMSAMVNFALATDVGNV